MMQQNFRNAYSFVFNWDWHTLVIKYLMGKKKQDFLIKNETEIHEIF